MAKMKFSDEQELAINARGKNYLISAGAGSGKTAVLTERIFRIVKEEKTLDKFLVLTFTNLAASEMKTRVRNKLINDEETISLASEVDNAHIETFDSFYLFLAKRYFYELGISKNPNIVDNSILTIKRKMYLDEVFNERCLTKEARYVALIEGHCIKNANTIKEYIIRLLNYSDRKGDKYLYLENLKNNYFSDELIDEAVETLYKEFKENIAFLRNEAINLQDLNDTNQIIEVLDSFEIAKDYNSLYELLKNTSFPRKPKSDADDGDYRDSLKDFFNKKIKISKNNDYGSKEQIKDQYMDIKPYVEEIIDIAIDTERRLDKFKLEYNAYSFGDISRFVLKLLKNENIRKEIEDSFDYIMVDEYQDTNEIQDLVLKSISKNNVYMVGDVKQSIYRFRGADCSIFQEKYERYKLHDGGEEIDLNRSYRSREEVVNFVNELFEVLMTKELNAIDYKNGHHFGFGRTEYGEYPSSVSYQPEVYKYSYEKSGETGDKEAELIAKDILTRKFNKYKVYNGEHSERDCDFKDFAIIIDRGTDFDKYRRVFADYNIPLKVESKETLFKSDVVSVLRSLVKMLYYSLNNDYGTDYKHAYFSIARSFLFEYRDDALYHIHKEDKYLLEPFAQKIELIKEKLRFASIKNVMLTLVEEFDIYNNISKITSFYPNAHKIENIISLCESMDTLGYTLKDFVDYFDDLAEQDIDMEYKDSDAQENSVTLLNIHASKGLEYGIVYYPGLIKEFNNQDVKSSYLISDRYGLVVPSTTISDYSSPFIHLIKEDIKKADFEEKIRLLYVAITRAKEKIIFVVGEKEKGDGLIKPKDSSSFKQMLNISNVLNKYNVNYSFVEAKNSDKEIERKYDKIALKSIQIPYEIIKKQRASKEVDEEVSEELLDFGTTIHAYLETLDFESDDLTYIADKRIRRYVENVKNSPILKDVINDEVRHEFPFIDEKNGVSGYIDLLVIKENEIRIIDFKLKNIDEIEYDKQLRTYKSFIAQHTDKPVKMYLLAAISGEVREVFDE